MKKFLLWPWINGSFANGCGPHSAKFSVTKKYFFHSCENRYSTIEIWGYSCNWSYWYGDPTCACLVGQRLHCSAISVGAFCFLPLRQSPEGWAALSSPLNTRMKQVLLPADLCLVVNWSFSKDVVAVSASLYYLVSNKVWAVATLFPQLEHLKGPCLLFNC